MASLSSPIESVPKISPKIVPALRHLGIRTIRDLLFYLPSRYEDFSNQKRIADLETGENATIKGEITALSLHRTLRKKMFLTEAVINDGTGSVKAVWYHQPFLARTLKKGDRMSISGKPVQNENGLLFQNPAHERIPSNSEKELIHTGKLVAIYPETQGISSRWLRYLIHLFINERNTLPDALPQETRERHDLPDIKDALLALHFPESLEEAAAAKRRLVFEKAILLQLYALNERTRLKRHKAPSISLRIPLLKEFVESLPFDLTDAQRRVIWEIVQDISTSRPMNRLLEGDVGSGKTIVAAAAAFMTVKSGFRVAFMAPTEILARQHYETLKKVLAPFRISIGLLTGSFKQADEHAQIIVGTHALIQKNARFSNLGLVVIDEQHRFGVDQRARLANRRAETDHRDSSQIAVAALPHFLSMTATPIPRTLALTLYSDLDLSLLDEMPKSRKEIITEIIQPSEREEAYDFIRKEVKKGRQVFVICPRIDAEAARDTRQETRSGQQQLVLYEVKAVKEEYRKLSEEIFPDIRVEMLHGKMKPKEKEGIMERFREGRADVLVSTSVVEVGVDVPNATIMMIEGAERFGLAQLHQFRGRVGRGAHQSYCLLFPTENGMAARRLEAVVESKNGFELAEKDLEIRGPGQLFGAQQSGFTDEDIEFLVNTKFIQEVRKEVNFLLKKSPDLSGYPELRKRLLETERSLHLE